MGPYTLTLHTHTVVQISFRPRHYPAPAGWLRRRAAAALGACIHRYLYISFCIYIFIYMYMYIYIYIYVCMYIYVYMYIYMYVCVCDWGGGGVHMCTAIFVLSGAPPPRPAVNGALNAQVDPRYTIHIYDPPPATTTLVLILSGAPPPRPAVNGAVKRPHAVATYILPSPLLIRRRLTTTSCCERRCETPPRGSYICITLPPFFSQALHHHVLL